MSRNRTDLPAEHQHAWDQWASTCDSRYTPAEQAWILAQELPPGWILTPGGIVERDGSHPPVIGDVWATGRDDAGFTRVVYAGEDVTKAWIFAPKRRFRWFYHTETDHTETAVVPDSLCANGRLIRAGSGTESVQRCFALARG